MSTELNSYIHAYKQKSNQKSFHIVNLGGMMSWRGDAHLGRAGLLDGLLDQGETQIDCVRYCHTPGVMDAVAKRILREVHISDIVYRHDTHDSLQNTKSDDPFPVQWEVDEYNGANREEAIPPVDIRSIAAVVMTTDKTVEDGSTLKNIRQSWLSHFPRSVVYSDSAYPEYGVEACCGEGNNLGININHAQEKLEHVYSRAWRKFAIGYDPPVWWFLFSEDGELLAHILRFSPHVWGNRCTLPPIPTTDYHCPPAHAPNKTHPVAHGPPSPTHPPTTV